MKTVNIYAAQGLRDSDPSPEVIITIAHPMPDVPHEQRRAFHASEAAALANALWNTLPGGTVPRGDPVHDRIGGSSVPS